MCSFCGELQLHFFYSELLTVLLLLLPHRYKSKRGGSKLHKNLYEVETFSPAPTGIMNLVEPSPEAANGMESVPLTTTADLDEKEKEVQEEVQKEQETRMDEEMSE